MKKGINSRCYITFWICDSIVSFDIYGLDGLVAWL